MPGLGISAVLFGILALLGTTTSAVEPVHQTARTVTGHQVVLRSNAPTVSPVTSVRSIYVLHCAGCHGMNGQGTYSAKVPDLQRMGHFLRLPGGRDFLIRVPGVMGSGLSDAQVADVINWLLGGLASDGSPVDQAPYTADDIRVARLTPLGDVMAERRRLVALAKARKIPLESGADTRP